MTIRIYNTLGGKKEEFAPLEDGKVKIYVCGPTVYDSAHIGHARSVVVFDVITRYFRASSYAVTYIRNFTDVDDKIINRANELGIDANAVAEKYIDEFHRDMDALNVKRPDHEPKVTENIPAIIDLVSLLIAKESAYVVDGDVYFAIETFKGYGKLSGRKPEEMEAGARVNVDERKRNPLDFALWKAAKPGEPAWDSPWGPGRPGWHIECSAMNFVHFGESFDIHGGGKDLIFPHHENEIAQSEGAFGKPMAKYWMHNGFVNIDKEKMSKSLGNFLVVRDVLKKYHPEAIRLFLLSSHYRSPIDYSAKSMDEATSALDKIYAALERIDTEIKPDMPVSDGNTEYWSRFIEAMNDDFNTAKGVGILFEAVRAANRMLDESAKTSAMRTEIVALRADMQKIGDILGILTVSPAKYIDDRRRSNLQQRAIDTETIERLIGQRTAARSAKDWKTADLIRDQLADMGIAIEDRPEGVIWKAAGSSVAESS